MSVFKKKIVESWRQNKPEDCGPLCTMSSRVTLDTTWYHYVTAPSHARPVCSTCVRGWLHAIELYIHPLSVYCCLLSAVQTSSVCLLPRLFARHNKQKTPTPLLLTTDLQLPPIQTHSEARWEQISTSITFTEVKTMISDYLHPKQDAARGMLGMWLTDALRPVCCGGDIMASLPTDTRQK